MGIIVAIDGPAGAGKSTVARAVADRLGFGRVDTGALYRAITWAVLDGHARDQDLEAFTQHLEIRVMGGEVYVRGRCVTDELRTEAVNQNVSAVAADPGVRRALLELQRTLGRAHPEGSVLEGRDIGTVVFPDAEVKVFLTASDEERARRRFKEMAAAGEGVTLDLVLDSLRRRDELDSGREVAPLRPAEDAVHVDSTGQSFEKVVEAIVNLVRER